MEDKIKKKKKVKENPKTFKKWSQKSKMLPKMLNLAFKKQPKTFKNSKSEIYFINAKFQKNTKFDIFFFSGSNIRTLCSIISGYVLSSIAIIIKRLTHESDLLHDEGILF